MARKYVKKPKKMFIRLIDEDKFNEILKLSTTIRPPKRDLIRL